MSKIISKGALAQVNDHEFEDMDVPEWGENAQVRIKVMNGREREQFENEAQKRTHAGKADTRGLRWILFHSVLVDGEGSLLFNDTKEAQQLLESRNSKVLDRIMRKALEINGLSRNALEEAEKNS